MHQNPDLSCPGEHGVVNLNLHREPTSLYNGDTSLLLLQPRKRTRLLENSLSDSHRDSLPVRPSALTLTSSYSFPNEYYGEASSSAADVPRPMRHSSGIDSSAYRDYLYHQQQHHSSRVPPTPPAHSRPFTRSSSVPDQGSYYDAGLSDIDDAGLLGLGATPLSERYKSRFQDWRAGSYSISAALRARGQRGLRLGRQFSVSSELPTSDPLLGRPPLHPYDQPSAQSHLLGVGGPLGGGIGSSGAVRDHDLLLHSRSPPLTLGRSLQLVTENFGRYSTSSLSADRRKKTVRFNSEEWGRQAAAAAAAGYPPSSSLFSGPSSLLTSYLDSCLITDDEDASWMSIEDVRTGRWARWEAVRQESQDSQTRDSGIETGSCFTSSEDSNRGVDLYLSKKVGTEDVCLLHSEKEFLK